MLGLTEAEQLEVYRAVVALVKNRLAKGEELAMCPSKMHHSFLEMHRFFAAVMHFKTDAFLHRRGSKF